MEPEREAFLAKRAEKTDPILWGKVKKTVTDGDKGGHAGQWSARKAQLAVTEYKREGGGYKGTKSADNHLVQWQHEDWGTGSGKASTKTGERYLPKRAREALTQEEYQRTSAKKRADARRGEQFSAQPKEIAEKTAAKRATGRSAQPNRKALMQEAAKRNVAGRSRMTKDQLAHALGRDA